MARIVLLEKAPAGAQLYAAAEEGIGVREITETIGRHLGIPAASIPAGQAADHFKGFPFITMDITMPNADTRRLLSWEPAHPGLIADLDDGHYFRPAEADPVPTPRRRSHDRPRDHRHERL